MQELCGMKVVFESSCRMSFIREHLYTIEKKLLTSYPKNEKQLNLKSKL